MRNESYSPILSSLAIADYRSFGAEPQYFPQFSKINILIGQNNCGKSNVLRFIHDWLARIQQHPRPTLTHHDRHLPSGGIGLQYGILPPYFDNEKIDIEALCGHFQIERSSHYQFTLNALFTERLKLGNVVNAPWFIFAEDGKLQDSTWKNAFKTISDHDLHNLWQHLTQQSGGSREQHWIPQTLQRLSPSIPPFTCHLIPAIRKIGSKGSSSEEFSGEGLIERLAKLQNPPAVEQQSKKLFKKIGDFLRTVTDNNSAEIEIPYDRDTILVHMDGKTLPLDSLGSGIHEVIILAAAATVLDNCVICMEEPELHLNPILQKKLVRYLQANTSNQYFITSHSAALMDTPEAEVYHITLHNGASLVERVTSDKQRSMVCEDLGYHPSDLLQTNCVIWVEGPSDRIYLNWWITAMDAELVEGIHYSIMFYGGRLASHLSGGDPGEFVDDFISLRRLNRRGVILIDSDRPRKGAALNSTKSRLRDEFDSGPGHAWITEGREIENYLEPELLKKTITAVHPNMPIATEFDKYDNTLTVKNRKGETTQASKVKVASSIISSGSPNLDRFNLRMQVNKLVAFIQESNPVVTAAMQ
ncbi:MAG: ATP-binding protein [Rhodoferax sp.]|nr:ATP-binding protein [Rhodoferax sp.]